MRYKCFSTFFFFLLPLLKLAAHTHTHPHTHSPTHTLSHTHTPIETHATLSSFLSFSPYFSFSSYVLSLLSPLSFSFSKSHINCSPPPYLPSIKYTLFPTFRSDSLSQCFCSYSPQYHLSYLSLSLFLSIFLSFSAIFERKKKTPKQI